VGRVARHLAWWGLSFLLCLIGRGASHGIDDGGREILMCTHEEDGCVHLSRVVLDNRHPECILKAIDTTTITFSEVGKSDFPRRASKLPRT
jgi:hypothetical protein